MTPLKTKKGKLNTSESKAGGEIRALRVPSTSISDHDALERIVQVLEKDRALAAWLQAEGREKPDLFLIAADKLSPQEQALLTDFSDVVIASDEDLVQRLVALERENRHLRSLSLTDELTGLYNYRFFAKQLDVEIARTRRTGQPCALMMIDLDDFKLLNDTLGHDEGNRFLVEVTQAILGKLRPTDILCRYGGDEFSIIMPATSLSDAMRIAGRLRESVLQMPPKLEKPFSVSIGMAEYDSVSVHDMSAFVNLADSALYQAKNQGKNRICYAGKLPPEGKEASVTRDEKAALLIRTDEE